MFIQLPKVNQVYAKGKSVGEMESVKATSEIFAPVTLKILKNNDPIKGEPTMINKGAEKHGWISEVEIENEEEFSSLMDHDKYKKFCEDHKDDH